MPVDPQELLAANATFYEAFARGDLPALERLWAKDLPVTCIHPGWEVLHGREQVLQSFRAIVGNGAPPLSQANARALPLGDDLGAVTCTEQLPGAQLAAYNLFAREGGRLRLLHHQATPIARATPQPAPAGGLLN